MFCCSAYRIVCASYFKGDSGDTFFYSCHLKYFKHCGTIKIFQASESVLLFVVVVFYFVLFGWGFWGWFIWFFLLLVVFHWEQAVYYVIKIIKYFVRLWNFRTTQILGGISRISSRFLNILKKVVHCVLHWKHLWTCWNAYFSHCCGFVTVWPTWFLHRTRQKTMRL